MEFAQRASFIAQLINLEMNWKADEEIEVKMSYSLNQFLLKFLIFIRFLLSFIKTALF